MSADSPDPLVVHLAAVAFTAEKLLLPQMDYLAKHGFRVRVACAPNRDGYPEDLQRFAPIDIRFPRTPRLLPMARAIKRLVGELRTLRPDILHLHTPAAAIPVRMIPRSLLPKDMKVFYTVHGYAHTWSNKPADRFLKRVEKALSPRADITFFQSREDFDKARQHGFKGELRYLGNGVQDEWFDIASPDRGDVLQLFFSGRLVREKGVLELAEAVADCEGVELTIAGAQLPTDRDGVEQEVRAVAATSAGRIRLLGMLDRASLQRALAASDAVVLPSHREGVPRSLIEGMAAGRPAIGTQIRGCRELITDGEDGILVDPGSVLELSRAIRRLKNLPASTYRQWSELARASMSQQFREADVFARLIDGYRSADEGPLDDAGRIPQRPVRVLQVAAVSFTLEKLLQGQLEHLQAQGFEVRVACAPDAAGFPESLKKFDPLDVRFPRGMRPFQLLHAMYALSRAIWENRPDIVHLHTPAAAIPARAIPRFLWPRNTKLCYTVHGFAHTWSGTRRDRILQHIERSLMPRADLVFFVSEEDLKQAREHGYRGNLLYLGNGVSDGWFEIGLPQRGDNLRLAYHGRVVEEKGIRQLLEAVNQVQGVHLTVAGAQLESDRDGLEKFTVETATSLDNLGKIQILGMLDQAELRASMQEVDAIVLPSYREGLPLSLIEGMAAARPAIATDVRGCRELVTDQLNGLLVVPRSTEDLRVAIEAMRDLSDDQFRRMAVAAREAMRAGYRECDVLVRLIDGYDSLAVTD